METVAEELTRKIVLMQRALQKTTNYLHHALYESSIQNARQILANYREVERLLNGGNTEDINQND